MKNQMIKPKKTLLSIMVFGLLLISGSMPVYSIEITSPQAPDCLTPNGTVNQPLTITLTTDVAADQWDYVVGHKLNESYVGVSLDKTTGELTGEPNVSGEFTFQVIAADSDGNTSEPVELKLCITRQPVDVMMVLDKSGSMSQSVPDGSLNKWQILKQSVRIFLAQYRELDANGDRVGVVYFDDSRSDFIKDGDPGLHLFNDPPNTPPIPLTGPGSILEDMNSQSPGGFTCLGGGVLAANGTLDNTIEARNVIVFSDGIQNREPSYDMATKTITDHNNHPDGTGWPSGTLDLSSPPHQMKIHTLSIGDNAVASVMEDIASAGPDKGSHFQINNTLNLKRNLDDMFDGAFISALTDFSPAIVDKQETTLPDVTIERRSAETFTVNNTADHIIIKTVGDPRDMDGLEMTVRKDGVTFSNQVQYMGGHIMFMAGEDLVESRGASMGGDWQVSFNGRRGITFTTTCIINDEYVDYAASAGGKTAPGEPLNLNLEVNLAGKPASNLTQSKAIVLKPGQDLNDLFAKAQVNVDTPSNWQTEKGVHPGQRKYEKLIAFNKNFINALKLNENTVNLNNNGDGSYMGQFNDTEESGVYKVIFRLRGSDSETGSFQRYHFTTTVIDFGMADTEQTVFRIDTSGKANQFMITPKNKFGHLIGPNRLNQIELLVDNEKVSLTDNLDGTYIAAVPGTGFFTSDPSVKLNIKTNNYTKTKLSQIPGGETVVDENKNRLLYIIIAIVIIIILLIARNTKKKKKKNS